MAILHSPATPESTAGHWYTIEGAAAHEVPKAKGDGMRRTTLRDARALGLLPSVTSVLSVLDKPQLGTWKQRQAILAAAATPRGAGEEEVAWCDRVLAVAAQPAADAADLGSRIHAAIEAAVQGREWDSAGLGVYVAPVLGWLCAKTAGGGKVLAQEAVVVDAANGFAGRVDAVVEDAAGVVWCIDWKSRRTRAGESDKAAFAPYDANRLQLAAYAAHWAIGEGRGWERVRCVNVVTSSTEPGRFGVAVHENPEAAWDAFLSVLALWRWTKDYDPRKKGGGV